MPRAHFMRMSVVAAVFLACTVACEDEDDGANGGDTASDGGGTVDRADAAAPVGSDLDAATSGGPDAGGGEAGGDDGGGDGAVDGPTMTGTFTVIEVVGDAPVTHENLPCIASPSTFETSLRHSVEKFGEKEDHIVVGHCTLATGSRVWELRFVARNFGSNTGMNDDQNESGKPPGLLTRVRSVRPGADYSIETNGPQYVGGVRFESINYSAQTVRGTLAFQKAAPAGSVPIFTITGSFSGTW